MTGVQFVDVVSLGGLFITQSFGVATPSTATGFQGFDGVLG